MMNHTDDCVGGAACAELQGRWNQPSGWAVDEAREHFPVDAPWCAIRAHAWELEEADAGNAADAMRNLTIRSQ